ncbi:MAG: YkgJ family cysteine cluster protein [Treponema sp.]|nr:YkgJ family cysteine cluster protein [Treponema sp.]
MAKRLFYSDGLFFSCTRCSTCCRYESGYVFLSEKDLELLAAEQKMRRGDFIRAYCRWVRPEGRKEYLSLKEKPGYDCIFWNNGCAVYRARPLQCRSFPFWDSVLSSRASWEAAGTSCPGMGKGEFHNPAQIEACLKARLAEPVIIRGTTLPGV